MPFFKEENSVEAADVVLKVVGDKTFRLTKPFWYTYCKDVNKRYRYEGDGVQINAHVDPATTDLASVPTFLWGVLASYGRQLLPALLHDQRCEDVRKALKCCRFRMRSQADHEFHRALRDVGVGRMRRRVFWVGVALGKYWAYGRARCLLLLLPHVLIGLAGLAGLVASLLGFHWFGVEAREFGLVLGASLAASVFWWRDWRLPVVAILAGSLLIPVMIFTYGAACIVFFTDGAECVFRWVRNKVAPDRRPRGEWPNTVEAVA
ncbi:DUF1353 domain-containing protein [Lentzea sp. NPDC058450]|uniref:DUF1353 domain-containing protein n=1 Tax=Lentzea sp. NPDC058450 TaxID=3346505 RepID=UPI00364C2CB7